MTLYACSVYYKKESFSVEWISCSHIASPFWWSHKCLFSLKCHRCQERKQAAQFLLSE